MRRHAEARELLDKVWAHEYDRNYRPKPEYVTNLSFQDILQMSKNLEKVQFEREKMRDPTIYKEQLYKYMQDNSRRQSRMRSSTLLPEVKADSCILFDNFKQQEEQEELENTKRVLERPLSSEKQYSNPKRDLHPDSTSSRAQRLKERMKTYMLHYDGLFELPESDTSIVGTAGHTARDELTGNVELIMQRRESMVRKGEPVTKMDKAEGTIYIDDLKDKTAQPKKSKPVAVEERETMPRRNMEPSLLRLASVEFIDQKREQARLTGCPQQPERPMTQIEANLERLRRICAPK